MFVVNKRNENGKIKGGASGVPIPYFAIKSLPGLI